MGFNAIQKTVSDLVIWGGMYSHKQVFINNLQWWLKNTGRRKSWVAEQCGISQSGFSQWITRGSFPANDEFLHKLSIVMGIPPYILFIENGVEKADKIQAALKNVL